MEENLNTYIKFIRMNTGEDLISEISKLDLENDGESYIFINPLRIIYNINTKNGNAIVSLMQWVFPRICDKQEFRIYSADIITMCDPSESMKKYYTKSLNSFDDMISNTNGKMIDQYDEDEEDEDDPTDEELEEIAEMMNEIQNKKRKLH